MNFIDELFENNSMYESLSKQMDINEYMYYKYITNSVGKFNKIKYNDDLFELIHRLEQNEEYEKCDELNKMKLDIPEGYVEPKCYFDINIILKQKGFDSVSYDILSEMSDKECVILLFQIIQGDNYKPLHDSVLDFIVLIFRNGAFFNNI
jgi:hypothetical protein